jgi:phage shock protein B
MSFNIFTLVLVIVSGILLIKILSILDRRKSMDRLEVDETRLMQEIYQGLQRMEQRVENLETLMMKEKKTKAETREERLEREFRNLED